MRSLIRLALPIIAIVLAVNVKAEAQRDPRDSATRGPAIKARKLSDKVIAEVTNMHVLKDLDGPGEHALLLLRASRGQLGLYRLRQGQLRLTRRTTPLAYVGKAASFISEGEQRIAIGYDYTETKQEDLPRGQKQTYRKKLPQLLRVVLYDLDLDNPEVIFEEQTDEGDITYLEQVNGKLFAGLLHSVDFSKGGYLQREGSKWKLFRLYGGRYQEQVAVSSYGVALGRSQRDPEEDSSELQIIADGAFIDLPSNKGVTAVTFLQAAQDKEPELLAADGLADVRLRRAHSELALYNRRDNKWSRRTVAKARKGDGLIDKLITVQMGTEQVVLAKGNRYITLYRPEKNWESELLYRKHAQNAKLPIDVVCLRASDKELVLAVLEAGEVSLLSYRRPES